MAPSTVSWTAAAKHVAVVRRNPYTGLAVGFVSFVRAPGSDHGVEAVASDERRAGADWSNCQFGGRLWLEAASRLFGLPHQAAPRTSSGLAMSLNPKSSRARGEPSLHLM